MLATAKLATFHAVSYCMRRDEDADFCLRYPFLNEDPVYRPATKELFTTAQNSLAKRLHSIILQQNEVSASSQSWELVGYELNFQADNGSPLILLSHQTQLTPQQIHRMSKFHCFL